MTTTASPAAPKVRRPGPLLGAYALICSALLAYGHSLTRSEIALREAEDLRTSLVQALPPELHDNDLLANTIQLERPDGTSTTIYRALRGAEVTAVAYNWTTEAGYGGPISLIVGVSSEGRIVGVRILSHSETPGLGDKIDIRKSNWIRSFEGRWFDPAAPQQWAVRKDGGDFDQFAGATITPRAVVGAVKASLEFFAAHRSRLLATVTAAERATAEPADGHRKEDKHE
ncbi:electron transport complex subunit RsxG [Thauera aromatica]|uniref:electron transport complex subunit RsxG n=1 Tax=Thauera aromatica TaxID=59405 RepID=UPI001FFDDF56|nr:electron transport complex subunit RsxG [Thauera aromatica]MCK2087883.1 electron transport complex subunit RsxG [Thauera aromatica]